MEEGSEGIKLPSIGPLLLLGTSPTDSPPWLQASPPTQQPSNLSRPPRSSKAPPPHAALYDTTHRPSLERSATLPPRLVANSIASTSFAIAIPVGYPSVLGRPPKEKTGIVESSKASHNRTSSKSSREKNVENQQSTKGRARRDSLSMYPAVTSGRSLLTVKGDNENSKGYVGSDFFGGSSQEDSAYLIDTGMNDGSQGEEMSEEEAVLAKRRHSLNYPFPAFLAPRALTRYPPGFVEYPTDSR